MIKSFQFIILIQIVFLFNSCLSTNEQYSKLTPGIWRAELFMDENNPIARNISKTSNTRDIVTGTAFTEGVLPFNFEVDYIPGTDSMLLTFINGEQRIQIRDIAYGRNKSTAKDSIRIFFSTYDTYIKADVEAGIMSGLWVNPRKKFSFPFRAIAGKSHRFTLLKESPVFKPDGRWETYLSSEGETDTLIGEFKSNDNQLSGTFISPTGDYGYLDGTLQGNRFFLSKFDGQSAQLISAHFLTADQIEGSFFSGKSYRAVLKAFKSDSLKISDPFTLSKASTKKPIDFSFPDTDGRMVSLSDPQFSGKVKIVTIMGTWCPNCMDETNFLLEYLKENPHKDLAVIGISFESYDDEAKNNRLIKTYIEKKKIPYPILLGGKVGKDVQSKLPFLTNFEAYPTMILINAQNQIVYVHTGFSGPATTEYEGFKRQFNQSIDEMVNEVKQ